MQKIDLQCRHPLYGVDATRRIEQRAQTLWPEHTLMQRAGLAVARLALAIAPHAQRFWVACGSGNNGGDGLEAAVHLQGWGKRVCVTWLGSPDRVPSDAAWSYERARQAGIEFAQDPPEQYDLCIDALLGIGSSMRNPQGSMARWIETMNGGGAPILAVDIPSGLQADTGVVVQPCVMAQHCLSLLTLKPGLFTAQGRDAAGVVWFDDLGSKLDPGELAPAAWLAGRPSVPERLHSSHKGSYGDVVVIGGAHGMTGAALLAARAALHAGAGRVLVGLLDGGSMQVDNSQPELMFRSVESLEFDAMTVVSGCGGGEAIRPVLARILASAARLVVDADALNAVAYDGQLQNLLLNRSKRRLPTVMTPHPLEAARLLGCTTQQVQHERLGAAQQLAQRYACCVVLKGSGTLIAAPGYTSIINATGNARLATAGTGDVLAGLLGARMAAGMDGFEAACLATFEHGLAADQWSGKQVLLAAELARRGASAA